MSRAVATSRLLLILPIGLLLGLFFVVPLAMVFSMSIVPFDPRTLLGKGFTLEAYTRILGDRFYLAAFVRTVSISCISAFIAAVLAYPIAYHLTRVRSSQVRALLTLVVLLPVMLSLAVTSFAWLVILGGNGIVNRLVLALHLSSEPLRLMYTEAGVVVVLVYSYLPYMVLSIYAALESIDLNLLRAALNLGASETRAFWMVTLPLSIPGVLSGVLLVFSLSAGAFVVPYVIGGSQVKVVPLLIYNFAVAVFDWPSAAAQSVLLLALTLGATFGLSRLAERRFMKWLRG